MPAIVALLRPAEPVERALTYSTMASSLAKGLQFSVSALYFVRILGLHPSTVGIGLTVAGGVGVAASVGAGYLVDRVGARRILLVATVGNGIGTGAYLLARDAVAFVVAACVVLGMAAMQRTAMLTVIAQSFGTESRIQVRARLRAATNVFIAVGTGVAAAALLVGTAPAYVIAMAGTAALVLGSAVPLRVLPGTRTPRAGGPRDEEPAGVSPIRDVRYLTATALNAVMCLQFGLLTVGVPLWVSGHTRAPAVTVSALLALNTVAVALFQARAARATPDVPSAGRAVAVAGVLLALACGLYAGAATGRPALAVLVLLAAAGAHSAGEILSESGSWTLAFDLADPRRAGAYQGVSQAGPAIGGMLAPAVVTATAIRYGTLGWAMLAAAFLAAALATLALSRRATRGAAVAVLAQSSG